MTGRPLGSPCAAPAILLQQKQIYVTAASSRFAPTALNRWFRSLVLCATIAAVAAPAGAATPPVPKSRPLVSADSLGAGGGTARLGAKLAKRLDTLSRMLAKAGLDVDRLVAEAEPVAGGLSEGRGGPLVPAAGRGVGRASERAAAAELDRLRRMQSVLLAMPLAAPMTEYKLNSGFGYRRDPFRRRGAIHTGLDFGGPRNAPILATAPGTVIEAGRSGAYGIMVVVDHGMGIETRYAHLSRALVRVGDKVPAGKVVGLMGRTGRATGPHLHYEIRVDGRPLNPKPFIEAGAKLGFVGS